jgi:AraC-like DNA-binding protein
MPVGAGFERRANEVYTWEGLKRGAAPFVLIQHTIAGRGELDFEGTRHKLLPGSTLVLSFPHANRYWLARGQTWEYFWIAFNGREALRIIRAVIDLKGPVLTPAADTVDHLAGACLDLVATADPAAGAVSARAYQALMALYDGAFGTAPVASTIAPPLARVCDYVADHLAEPLGVDRLAEIAGLSRAHFVRRFAAELGLSPSDFVFTERMEHASRLLTATDLSVVAIAAAAGFQNGNYFAKAFRRHVGLSPGDFRKQAVAAG